MYLSLFLMMTLMILVSATWMGLYLAKRITRPVQMLAAGRARDRRRPPRSPDRAGDARRVRLARSRRSTRWRRSWRPASASSNNRARPRAEEPAARRAPPLHRDDARAHRDGRRLARRRRADRDHQRRGAAAARASTATVDRHAGRATCSRATICSRSARCCARRTRRARHAGGARDHARARRPRTAPGGRGDAAAGRGRRRSKARCSCSTT